MIHGSVEKDCEWMSDERIDGSLQPHENGLNSRFYKSVKRNDQKERPILSGASVKKNIFVKSFSKIFCLVWTL